MNLDLVAFHAHVVFSYRSEEPTYRAEAQAFSSANFPGFVPQEVLEILDAGRSFNGGHPPATIKYGGVEVANFRKDQPPTTILGAEQKAWFLENHAGVGNRGFLL